MMYFGGAGWLGWIVIELHVPALEAGTFDFTSQMGMLRGHLVVEE